jgi:hypothetical protein
MKPKNSKTKAPETQVRQAPRELLFQPRRSVTAHRPGLEGVQGEEGVREPHSTRFDPNFPLSSSVRLKFEWLQGPPPAIHRRVDTPLRPRLDSESEIGGKSSL